jgi:hypothetical protein
VNHKARNRDHVFSVQCDTEQTLGNSPDMYRPFSSSKCEKLRKTNTIGSLRLIENKSRHWTQTKDQRFPNEVTLVKLWQLHKDSPGKTRDVHRKTAVLRTQIRGQSYWMTAYRTLTIQAPPIFTLRDAYLNLNNRNWPGFIRVLHTGALLTLVSASHSSNEYCSTPETGSTTAVCVCTPLHLYTHMFNVLNLVLCTWVTDNNKIKIFVFRPWKWAQTKGLLKIMKFPERTKAMLNFWLYMAIKDYIICIEKGYIVIF